MTLTLDLTESQIATLAAMDAEHHRASAQAESILAAAIEAYGGRQMVTERPTFRRCGGLRIEGR